MQIDLSDLKVGDKAYSAIEGSGVVVALDDSAVFVEFILDDESTEWDFHKNGKYYYKDTHPALFHSKQEWLEYVQWACRERKYVLAKDIDENFKAGCRIESTSKYLWVYNDNNNACEILAYLQTEPKEDAIDRLIKTGWIKEVE